jgi:hypothetical protein
MEKNDNDTGIHVKWFQATCITSIKPAEPP